MSKLVSFDFDPANPPPLTPKLREELRRLATTVRIDADVLAWLKAGGKGYQTRLNAILRAEMLRARG